MAELAGIRRTEVVTMMSVWTRIGAVACLIAPLLAACGTDVQDTYPTPQERHPTSGGGYSGPNEGQDSIFGPGGLFGKSDTKNQGGGGGGIGVNAYLWRATLDTISFLPLTSADPFGGVIITDWYQPPELAQRAPQADHRHSRPPTARRRYPGQRFPPDP